MGSDLVIPPNHAGYTTLYLHVSHKIILILGGPWTCQSGSLEADLKMGALHVVCCFGWSGPIYFGFKEWQSYTDTVCVHLNVIFLLTVSLFNLITTYIYNMCIDAYVLFIYIYTYYFEVIFLVYTYAYKYLSWSRYTLEVSTNPD